MKNNKPIVAVDFDRVIHSDTNSDSEKEWHVVKDPPVPGAIDWLFNMVLGTRYKIVIHTCRASSIRARIAMIQWLRNNGLPDAVIKQIEITRIKPQAHIYIDDRAWCFKGEFPNVWEINAFKPWNKKGD